MADPTSVAVLGTGIMGSGIARNLCRTGHAVRVWNRTRAKAEPLAADGARVADTPAQAVDGADVALTMLYDGASALAVMRAAAAGLRPGMVWAQSSTVGIEGLAPLAAFARAEGLAFVDAPVLGTRQPAEQGKLVVLAAGPPSVRAAVQPVFDAIGSRTLWVADSGEDAAASRLKLVCNSWVLALNHATAEALALAKGLGADPQGFLDAVAGGPLDSGYLRMKAAAILSGDYAPNFALSTAAKDTRLMVAAAEQAGIRMDLAAAGAERFRRAEAAGHGAQDMAASYFAGFDGDE